LHNSSQLERLKIVRNIKGKKEKMNTNQPQNNNHHQIQLHIWQNVDRWRQLSEEVIKRLPKGLQANASERVKKSAESRIAETRVTDMNPIASRQSSPATKQATKIIVVVVGALTFSAGTQVLTSRLGAAALPAAMAGGALASFLVDDRATKVMTKMRIVHGTKQELNAIGQGQSPINELDELFYQSQKALVQQVEGKNLEKQLAIDAILAGILSAGEFSTALWIVVQMGLPGGILIEAIAASLPVTIVWLAAAFQSDRFELPEHYDNLIKKYLPYLFPAEGMPEAEVQKLFADKESQEARLDFLVKYIAEGDSNGRLKNMAMAEADYEIEMGRDRKQQLELERDRAIEQRLFQHRTDLAELPNKFPAPEIEMTGAPHEIKERQQKVERIRVQWIKDESAKLEEILAQDIKMISHRYETQIKQCEDDIAAAQKRYEEAYRNWKDDHEDSGGNFGDAA
jgi:hypothetical protein